MNKLGPNVPFIAFPLILSVTVIHSPINRLDQLIRFFAAIWIYKHGEDTDIFATFATFIIRY